MPPKADWEKYDKPIDDDKEQEQIKVLDEGDIALLKTYGQGPYGKELKKIEVDIRDVQKRVNEKMGVKESDTGLAPPNLWDLPADKLRMAEEHPLQVARCTKIIQASDGEDAKYLINVKLIAKYVVGLGERVAPTDIEEGMRVGVDRNKYQIQIPLPPKIDPSVTMMQVEEKPDVTYSDVGGCKEQIEKLREVVEMPLLQPERFVDLGIDPPKGVLLYGPPGTGKTLCARAVANRTDATFIRVIGSELVQKYVGEGARMVRELFEMARTKKACIIFFDEVDAIGGARFDDGAGGDNEVQRTMLELINQLDGFDPRGNIKVLMATNRPDTLDPALMRPGRLDRKVEFGLPDLEGRAHIFKIHARSMSVERDIRYELLARLCPNATGAELRSVCTEAGMFAIRSRRKVATEKDFLEAVNKVIKSYAKGKRLVFVTNNSSKSRASYVKKFRSLGIEASETDIFGSAFAAAFYIKNVLKLPADKKVYLCGMSGLEEELAAEGIPYIGASHDNRPIKDMGDIGALERDPNVGAVLFGFDIDVNYRKLATAFTYLNEDPSCHFIATNTDLTYPAGGKIYPGTGALLSAVTAPLGRKPIVVGKPQQIMLDLILQRLDTDILFGQEGGLKTVLVLTGVSKESDVKSTSIIPDVILNSVADLVPK
ncbi:26S proteasome regulatory subunit 7 [Phlyctochytrium bullatum]|nr:26S proteasome regulatory subunit 7 [Phlyctochytrium bullatum]